MSLISTRNSAAHRVLHLPEMLTMIAEVFYDDAVAKDVRPDLANFVKVNHLWYHSAIHILWRNLSLWNIPNLADIFANINPSRRNFLASYVEAATVHPERSALSAHAHHLGNIEFPKLRELHIYAVGDCNTQLPLLGKHDIQLVSCVHRGGFVGKPVLTPAVIDQCLNADSFFGYLLQATFPDLEHLRFSYPIPSSYHGYPLASNNLGLAKLDDAGFEPVPGPTPFYWVAFSCKPSSKPA
ncbi:hypothetical protein PG995_005488 [Apiospora arundinis]